MAPNDQVTRSSVVICPLKMNLGLQCKPMVLFLPIRAASYYVPKLSECFYLDIYFFPKEICFSCSNLNKCNWAPFLGLEVMKN